MLNFCYCVHYGYIGYGCISNFKSEGIYAIKSLAECSVSVVSQIEIFFVVNFRTVEVFVINQKLEWGDRS